MILIAFRHGLRAGELCDLQWHQVELETGRLHVRRSKRGTPSVHPIQGNEIRALRRLQRDQPPGPHVFTSERGGPMTPKSFHALIERLGKRAGPDGASGLLRPLTPISWPPANRQVLMPTRLHRPWATTEEVWGSAFEDFLTRDFDDGSNIVEDYLKRRG